MPNPISLSAARRRKRTAGTEDADESPPCPITPLGHINGHFWFLNIVGERRSLSARQLGRKEEIAGLFLGDMHWLTSGPFKTTDEDGKSAGFKISKVCEYLMNECRKVGLYGDHIVVRRAGVWPGGPGAAIAHCGDALFLDGEQHEPGQLIAGQIFAAAPRETYPDADAAPALVVQEIAAEMRELWNFRDDGGEIIAIGLVGQAFYAAALTWRANGFITGPSGSGKSELLDVLRKMMPMHHYSTDTTPAGVQSAINGKAMPAFLDELADRAGEGGQALMDIVLSASSGAGTLGHRGTADGGVRSIEVAASAIMASIAPPPMQAQHRTRFSIIELQSPDSGADHRNAMKSLQAKAEINAPRIFTRALAGFARYHQALGEFRKALALMHCVPREMDQLGSILAGAWMLLHDGVPDAGACMEIVKMVADFVRGREEMQEDDGPTMVLNKLLSHVVSLHRSTDQESLGRIIRNAMLTDNEATVRMIRREDLLPVLDRWGIRVMRECDVMDGKGRLQPRLFMAGDALWIDPRVDTLRKIFDGTPYAGDRWVVQLMRLPGVHRSKNNIRVGALSPSKAIWLPWNDNDEDNPDTG